jgi:hypothetical protein
LRVPINQQISNDGTIEFRGNERLSFEHLVSNQQIGQECTLHVLREGQRHTLSLLASECPRLVPRHRARDTLPSYIVVGGIVITTLS